MLLCVSSAHAFGMFGLSNHEEREVHEGQGHFIAVVTKVELFMVF